MAFSSSVRSAFSAHDLGDLLLELGRADLGRGRGPELRAGLQAERGHLTPLRREVARGEALPVGPGEGDRLPPVRVDDRVDGVDRFVAGVVGVGRAVGPGRVAALVGTVLGAGGDHRRGGPVPDALRGPPTAGVVVGVQAAVHHRLAQLVRIPRVEVQHRAVRRVGDGGLLVGLVAPLRRDAEPRVQRGGVGPVLVRRPGVVHRRRRDVGDPGDHRRERPVAGDLLSGDVEQDADPVVDRRRLVTGLRLRHRGRARGRAGTQRGRGQAHRQRDRRRPHHRLTTPHRMFPGN